MAQGCGCGKSIVDRERVVARQTRARELAQVRAENRKKTLQKIAAKRAAA